MSPEEVISFLNEYFNEIIEVAVKYDGNIDKFIGDGMIVIFGIPFQTKDHATKALMASIDMQEALSKINQKREQESKSPIRIGIGLHSGTVLAGNIGNKRKLQYTVIEDSVNVASRIENINKQFSTTILFSEATYKRLFYLTRKC
ncbi:MAG: adenylate/guanylate cyclase domain-containing protein [Spirochaetota bacterium]